MVLGEPTGDIMMRVEYRLTAQLTPWNDQHWIGHLPAMGISLCRHEKPFIVNRSRDVDIEVQQNVQQDLQSKVGGFLGMGKTESRSNIELERDVYSIGEKIRVKINCDNSACKKPVDAFKLKLLRNIQCVTYDDESDTPKMTNHQKYINVVKVHENVGPRDTVEDLQMEIDIPEFDDYYPESFEQLLPLFR